MYKISAYAGKLDNKKNGNNILFYIKKNDKINL